MTRYGFAIEALPQGGKPFGEQDDENDETVEASEQASLDRADPTASGPQPNDDDFEDELSEEPNTAPA
ncbi:hypothetical protein [Streptomyces zhihengii]|uniref:Uncharacterized protein n=1 Tax=Streptomyces zhihengii TaxID=1818004 RepID=A0ABS2V5G2_9ACTN|nr:hypothetical protein [Streptomyces zhihengii]MBM9624766.1 hypothetical protein [Streptomyces zhihengii]